MAEENQPKQESRDEPTKGHQEDQHNYSDLIGLLSPLLRQPRRPVIRAAYYVVAVLYTIGCILALAWVIVEDAPYPLRVYIILSFSIGIVGWRLAYEMLVLLHSIYQRLTTIQKIIKESRPKPTTAPECWGEENKRIPG